MTKQDWDAGVAEFEQDTARQVEQAIIDFGNHSTRSRQSVNHVLGVSDIGHCREYARRMILQEPHGVQPTTYAMASFAGTAIGSLAEDAVIASLSKMPALKQRKVTVLLPGDITLTGHPDLVLPNAVIDFKTADGLAVVRADGASTQQRFQVTLYAKALIDVGMIEPDAWCVLVWLDRSGRETRPHVQAWRYDPAIVEEAAQWIDDVLYAYRNNEEASRDKPREFCWACCPFVQSCRGGDTDATGLLDDPAIETAIAVLDDAKVRAKSAENDRKAALAVLNGSNGSTGRHTVRWVEVPETTIKPGTRRAFLKLDVRPIQQPTRESTDGPAT